jgi:hypothetical protein
MKAPLVAFLILGVGLVASRAVCAPETEPLMSQPQTAPTAQGVRRQPARQAGVTYFVQDLRERDGVLAPPRPVAREVPEREGRIAPHAEES